ncbi:MAG: adenine-specific methyltransferase EcoRI family protein [Selenomonadaceae bacterium]|nr:adenine-specific methyltransferase EcoRI family protein [Selenomonadaceae bacterium]
MANKNKNLNAAARAKKDKFYTQLEDIENELRHYREFFKGKTVLCNCDDPFESNFFKYFAANFNALELKKLITTSYADSPICQLQLEFFGTENQNFDKKKDALMIEVTELRDWNGDGREDLKDVEYAIKHNLYKTTRLKGDSHYCAGDFRTKELIVLLPQADVVVTNPPFSGFRDYLKQLIDAGKKFLILGNKNALTYKEVFPLIMQNKIWTGFTGWSGGMWFISDHEDYYDEIRDGVCFKNVASIWYTNIETPKRFWDIPLYKNYSPEEYPRYDNYDAIEVSKTAEIPVDYFGVMGVPITFLDKYNPNQFEILGCTYSYGDCGYHVDGTAWGAKINGKDIYKRIFIRRRTNDTSEQIQS